MQAGEILSGADGFPTASPSASGTGAISATDANYGSNDERQFSFLLVSLGAMKVVHGVTYDDVGLFSTNVSAIKMRQSLGSTWCIE